MLIGEVAALAQVTPRAVRHYHRIGLLPEPERRQNGYRTYSLIDLTRLLRIRGLVALGLPLDRVREMMTGAPERTSTAELVELESVLRDQIRALNRQLDAVIVAQASAVPEVTPLYDEHHQVLQTLLADPEVRQVESDISLLLAATRDRPLLERLSEELGAPLRVETLARATQQLRAISDSSSDVERDATVDALRTGFSGIKEVQITNPLLRGLLEEYVRKSFNTAQLDVLRRAFGS